jgi:UDP-glucose 4-epimerase
MRVLVIGGAGYIGAHVVLALQEAGHTPIVFDDLSTGARENIAANIPLVVGNILDASALDSAFSQHKPDAVIHLAAKKAAGESMREPELYARVNIAGTINVLAAMLRAGCDEIIFSSSAAVYGSPHYVPMDEEHPTTPENFYGHTKLVVEGLLSWYGKTTPLRSVALRYFNAAGYDERGRITVPERDPQNLLPILLEAAAGKRKHVDLYGNDYDTPDGTCVRDYVHVTDLARAHVAALSWLDGQQPGTSIALNLGTGKGASVKECVAAVEELYGAVPADYVARRPGDPGTVITDAKRAKELLGWTPQHTEIKQILSTMGPLYKLKRRA